MSVGEQRRDIEGKMHQKERKMKENEREEKGES